MMSNEEAWALVKANPCYYHDAEESPKHGMIMNDVWGWACADGFDVSDENIVRVAELLFRYGFCGLLYYQAIELNQYFRSEFTDNNRSLQFVIQEEAIRKEVPDSNKRAYAKRSYVVDGEIPRPEPKDGDATNDHQLRQPQRPRD